MKRFIIFRLALVFLMAAVDFTSCSFFEPSDGANVSFTIDKTMAQKISEEAGVRLAGRSAARSLTADEMQGLYFEITLNGSYQDSKTVPVTENATITFENVPVGFSIYARGLAYKTDAGKKLGLYEGQSETIIVSDGTNALSLALRRSSYSEPIPDPDGEGYETTISGLTSLLNSLAANSVGSPYSIKITDSVSNFNSANTSITNALASVSGTKYIKLAFKNASFTSMSGTLSSRITGLEIPAPVTRVDFIDMGENFSAFTVATGNSTFTASDGILYQNSGRKIVRYPAAYPETTATIASNITAIADGAFAGCKNIASFSVASGNTYFKVVSGEWATNTSTYSAYQQVRYWQRDTTIPDAPQWGSAEYDTWEQQNTLKINKQDKTEYVPVPVLTSYDGKTLYACPPAVTFETQTSLMTKAGYVEGTTDQLENTITERNYVAYTPTFNFETVRPYAFSNVAGLTGATITDPRTSGSTFTELVAYTFKDCVSLTTVTLGASIEIVKANALAGCTALTEIDFKAYNSQTTSTNTLASYVENGAYPSSCDVTLKAIGTSN